MSCSASGGWEQGWLVFHDQNNNGLRDTNEAIILKEGKLATSLRLTGNANVAKYVSFSPTGSTRLIGGGFQAGTLTLCRQSESAVEARQIIINAVGRARVSRTSVGYCA